MTNEELLAYIKEIGKEDIEEYLVDLVYDCKHQSAIREADEIADAGLEVQLKYLSEYFGGPDKLKEIINSINIEGVETGQLDLEDLLVRIRSGNYG